MDTTDLVPVAVVGCGFHGLTMAAAVLRSDSLRLVAGVDPDEEALRRVAELDVSIATYGSTTDLLETADVDAVVIATPHDCLAPTALAAIRAGKHVLIEKPMALDEAQARQVEFAAASAGVTCMVGYSFRFGMGRFVHDPFAAGLVGDLVAITGSIGLPRLDDGWMSVQESGGGPLLYVGCHLVDLILWLTGEEPQSVTAAVTRRPQSGVDDTSAVQLQFTGDRLAQLLVTQSAPGFGYDLQVIGSAGSIKLRGRDFRHYEVEVHSMTAGADAEPTVQRPASDGEPIDLMFVPELAEFADAIEHGRSPAITASDARRVLRVLDAVAESGRTRQAAVLGVPMLAAY
jgi:predicted dehydrogenase